MIVVAIILVIAMIAVPR
ncbi:MAG: hypothetical protein WDO18_22260 [Acidobacteriota bacterium]